MRVFHIIMSSILNIKLFFLLIKQQLKKTLRKFILYIVIILIYTLMKKIKSNFTKKLC